MQIKFFEWADYEAQVYEKLEPKLPHTTFTPEKFSTSQAQGYEAISIFIDSEITAADLEQLPNLKTIAIRASGYNNVDLQAAKSRNIQIYRVASYSPESIAEHVFALLLDLVRRLKTERAKHEKLENGRTLASMGTLIHGKTLGLYGVGKIGTAVAKIAKGFDMKIIYYDKYVKEFAYGTPVNSLEKLFSGSDVVSVHVPLTDETQFSINTNVLARANPGLYLINTARGDILDVAATLQALEDGTLAGLGVDVWDSGDVDDKFDDRLWRDNVIQTDHVAFFTYEAVRSILEQTIENLTGKGKSENQVM